MFNHRVQFVSLATDGDKSSLRSREVVGAAPVAVCALKNVKWNLVIGSVYEVPQGLQSINLDEVR